MKTFYTFIILFISCSFFGQNGSISGKVVDDANGSNLPGVNILIKTLKFSTTSDSDGKFVFRNVPSGSYEVEFSYIGYLPKIISEVVTKNNEITYLNTTLAEVKNELKEVVITRTKAKAESIKSLLVAQKNSITVSDGISAESMKRTPDKTTSDVLKRISGVSVQDNKFVVIRGLNDRYNFASLNGAPLPSSEPDRKAFSFDIFPANMLDNLVITKTASPDLPGEFVGGVIQINTKSVPDKNFQSITIGQGYNTITTFKDQKSYEGSSADWLGFDNGARDLPSNIPSSKEFATINGTPTAANLAKTFEYDWSINKGKFNPNTAFQYSIGHHFDFGEKVFGVLFSVSHNLTNNYNEVTRNEWDNGDPTLPSVLNQKFDDKNYSQQILTGSLANFSMKFNENHSVSFKNILSINSNDLVVERSGKTDVNDPRLTTSNVRWFTSNIIYSGQLNGEHYFTQPKIKLNWLGFYSNIQRSIPNLRRNVYVTADPDSSDPLLNTPRATIAANNGGPDYGGGMFFAENSESISGGKIDLSKKFNIGKELINELKIGGFTQKRARDFFARQLQYNQNQTGGTFDQSLLSLTDANIFTKENMGFLPSGKNGFTLYDLTKPEDAYDAGSQLNAGYIMLDNRYKKFRFIWGVRIENFVQTLQAETQTEGYIDLNSKKTDVLPSANFIYSVNSKQNLRLSYSKTLNRPEYRELAPFAFYDFTTQFFTQGNVKLERASIQNYDFRYEIFPAKGQLFTVSYFYKKFEKPIELIQQPLNRTITYNNANSAINTGVELEFRVLLSSIFASDNATLFDDLTLFSNIAVIKSKADVKGVNGANPETTRTMQGQSPYVFNGGLQYMNKDIGLTISGNINRAGNRIAYASSELKPAIWEKGRTFIDMQIAKSIFKNTVEFKLNIQNLLAQDLIFYQNNYRNTVEYGTLETLANAIFTGDPHYEDGYNPADDDAIWLTKFGRSFSFSATYNF
ncbi:TonB-dependent receptor domain-containing protein [Flavobacterium sp.]|uniref:TonB-dependent receptor n=1 Tax=Flavobacterium sp. TaxID=239 RepID=UPI00286E3B80|nr:TonB-dependent receptor [Flavobacterium sp.]